MKGAYLWNRMAQWSSLQKRRALPTRSVLDFSISSSFTAWASPLISKYVHELQCLKGINCPYIYVGCSRYSCKCTRISLAVYLVHRVKYKWWIQTSNALAKRTLFSGLQFVPLPYLFSNLRLILPSLYRT